MNPSGRPPSSDPKGNTIPVRLDQTSVFILDAYCEKHEKKRAQAIREAILRLDEDESRYFWSPEWKEVLKKIEDDLDKQMAEIQDAVQATIGLIRDMRLKIGVRSEESDENDQD
ncbi:hypothetical protein [Paenibacillus graminis]|uniref:hypothetical protein n=1 Tax=Paenibacillus graminis TaxID=189425 RepID=UPI002DB857A0|nr:hypothetical protein [Paenibacillus graminis]MEC0167360.1 hypothetical protein [Paenibacillus graminis]